MASRASRTLQIVWQARASDPIGHMAQFMKDDLQGLTMRLAAVTARAVILRFLNVLLGATFLVLIAMAPAVGQQGDLNAIQKRLNEFIATGTYPAALVEAQMLEAGVKARFGPNHRNYAVAPYELARVYWKQGKYAEAEGLWKRSLAISEKTLGAGHSEVVDTLGNLAVVYKEQGRYAEAEGLLKRALTINEKARGGNHPSGANTLHNLADLYQEQGKYADAEGLYKRSLAIREKVLGQDNPEVADTLNNLANVYHSQGKYAAAEGLHKRSLAIREKVLGQDNPEVAKTLNNLAGLYEEQGKYAAAEGLHKRALAIKEKALGADHPGVAITLHNLAAVHGNQAKYADAEGLLTRALATKEKALGADHPSVAITLRSLAAVYGNQAKYADAEALYKRALAIREQAFGASHPEVAENFFGLATMESRAHDNKSAVEHIRKATAVVLAHAAAEASGAAQKSESSGLVAHRAGYFLRHIAYLDAAVQEGIQPLPAATREAFEMAQWANHSSAAAAVQQMGLRFAAGSDALAALVRQRQDLSAFWRDRDKALLAALSQPQDRQSPTALDALRKEIAEIERKQAANTARLAREFPAYAALASPQPLKPEELQQLFGGDEALVFFLSGEKHWEIYVFALTREGFEWRTIPLKGEALAEKVAAIRRGLDVDALHRGLQRAECTQAEAEKRGLSRVECASVVAKECEEADLAERAKRGRRRSPHRERGGAAQAQRGLGGALRLQHHCRRQARRGSIVRPRPRLLLCRRAGAARDALGGGEQRGDAAHHRDIRRDEVRSVAWSRRGAAPRHARLHRRPLRSAQRLPRLLGTVRCRRRGRGEIR